MRPPDPHPRIMIVDDTPANLKLLEGMLKEKGIASNADTQTA